MTKYKSYYIINATIGVKAPELIYERRYSTMGDNVFFDFLKTYWADIVALFDKIYFSVKKYFTENEAE